MQIANSVVAITGAGRGLGRATAEYLAERGARLALIDLNEDDLKASVEACAQHGAEVRSYGINVAVEEEVDSGFAKIAEDFGGLQVLVNNAGIMRDGMLLKVKDGKVTDRMSLAQWQSVIDVNLTGVFLCGRAAAAIMAERGEGGVIVNISSLSRAGNMGQTNYSASKAGVAAMTVTWARELARYGIRAAAIAPGFINTDMVAQMRPEILDSLVKQVPLRRLGEQEEIASTVAFILENDFVSGRVLDIDGGARI
ncbi:SDR family oxidoreductase [Microbulbifer thermotolerans]|uniref:3-ketoacyl-ACP reductase n=1 Tax=Microbulbifer thermotolerans TaxID=252514 RepID=A0A143HNE2_MICTH|nr:SDR family oxidoreductase [Microbulbifer thermotolerans]AMX03021.1 3-ketoacyl-ACP reductase [Microbulbifer thermotolerans]MCX2778977.1 SDR family oxidoreductase [Microbulbifer thermotolerans]MCX2781512.1 SDR family oxidoreductase [Microbulbifer thermotolerans]MCX2795751.1 SDR family oxidoreductase [Microbulbifer thermotolerans]MCX2802007.1 SDR family oxidoreductase [Microbulbifer thermotolerans]